MSRSIEPLLKSQLAAPRGPRGGANGGAAPAATAVGVGNGVSAAAGLEFGVGRFQPLASSYALRFQRCAEAKKYSEVQEDCRVDCREDQPHSPWRDAAPRKDFFGKVSRGRGSPLRQNEHFELESSREGDREYESSSS